MNFTIYSGIKKCHKDQHTSVYVTFYVQLLKYIPSARRTKMKKQTKTTSQIKDYRLRFQWFHMFQYASYPSQAYPQKYRHKKMYRTFSQYVQFQ